ncbi:MAG: hypothetical protein JJT78_02015 [Leptospira sp.]|nr:hypothetical protein [Leptospira sp.]
MNQISGFFYRLIIVISTMTLLLHCNRQLEIQSIEFCDLWDSKGNCLEPWEKQNHDKNKNLYLIQYKIPKNISKNLNTWKELSHYLYFQAKETPGILVHWNHELTEEKRKQIRTTCKAHYIWNGMSGEMEGNEIGKSYHGYFHYVGSMIEIEKKNQGLWESKPDFQNMDSNDLEMELDCLGIKKSLSGNVQFKNES